MGYRLELIRRMRRSGDWNNLTAAQQQDYRRMTNAQARRAMVFEDGLAQGDRQAWREARLLAFEQVSDLFQGALLNPEGLTPAGMALGRFFAELRRAGVATPFIEADLHELNMFVRAALVVLSNA